ncbi:MAG: amidase [Proteobacteria bacterium]|nr:amidase [Pseudomonadota bacterium]MDA1058567.1 amidase [Pseudomonadota bacterium]
MTFARDPGSVASLVADMQQGKLDPVDLLETYISRIDQVDVEVQAWRVVAHDRALEDAKRLKEGEDPAKFALFGLPVGVKDIIDVAGVPTRNGSPRCETAPPATADAVVVADLRAAGAIILGKTHTTEYAHFGGPYPTRNPHDLARTPGGSSAGSGAAVAAGMVPAALGTQTAGSVNRPAAYCGVGAFKPSSRSLSIHGVTSFSPHFDTIGTFGHRARDAAYVFCAVAPRFLAPDSGAPVTRLIALDDPIYAAAETNLTANFRQTLARFASTGFQVDRQSSPVPFAQFVADHKTISEYELGRGQGHLLDHGPGVVNTILIEAIERGLATTETTYKKARQSLFGNARTFWANFGPHDIIVAPAVPDVAPIGRSTGDPQFITPFTAVDGPIATIPTLWSAGGLPECVLTCAQPGADLWLAARVPALEEAIRQL